MEKRILAFLRPFLEVTCTRFNPPQRGPRRYARHNAPDRILTANLQWFIGGCLAAGLTLFLVRGLFISPARFLTITLFLGPFFFACLRQEIRRRQGIGQGSSARPRSYFSQTLWYSLGFAWIKFFFFPSS
ncbi:MAG TPA: hypothetical protein VE092_22105 [Herbaspirillum sp.]|uniref:hypothetical protein n=1 Tax=Herbaspirillum sp. TaxID=1890675 RepID=UPI002D5F0F76|nr:hypothetical protein [Herbaspirillum sp.]HZG22713.1 hypothetical protein [Herbaspirillum sp.]